MPTHCQWRQTGGLAKSATRKVRVGNKPQDRQGAGPHDRLGQDEPGAGLVKGRIRVSIDDFLGADKAQSTDLPLLTVNSPVPQTRHFWSQGNQ
jgi:hypothetical protein